MLDTKPAPRIHARVAKSWRNYYRVYRVLNLGRLGHVFPGVHGGPDAFPSQEIAEAHARAILNLVNPPGRFYMDYVAAFP